MGEWIKPNARVLLGDVLGSEAFGIGIRLRDQLAAALVETGFIVTTEYYVPDVEELFAMYRSLAEVDYQGRGSVRRSWIRWVMCGETQEALQAKYGNQQTFHAPNLAAFMIGSEPEPTASVIDELHMVMTTRAAKSLPAAIDAGRLFDMPIRRDPAARRPMFELTQDPT